MDTILRGFLLKEGGHGHQYKNERKRWFVLKDMFLFYYSEPSSPSKNMHHLRGIVHLKGCSIKDYAKAPQDTFILVSPKKEFLLSSLSDNPIIDLENWRHSLEFSIKETAVFEDAKDVASWVMKKGHKGHNFQNWKRRYFVLKGSCIFYYEDAKDREKGDENVTIKHRLKGFIELSQITDINTDLSSDENGFQFIVTVNNEKSYILGTKTIEEKNLWVDSLRDRISRISKLNVQVSLHNCNNETVMKSGELQRHLSTKSSANNFVVLTNVHLRVYSTKVDTSSLAEHYTKSMILSIPLVGLSIHVCEDGEDWDLKPTEMALIDIHGNPYIFEAESAQSRTDWVSELKAKARGLAKQFVLSGDCIRLTCNASDKNDINAGYTIMTLNKESIRLNYLMLSKEVVISFDHLKLVFLQPDFLLCLKYVSYETGVPKAKQLKMKTGTAGGLFEAIEAIFELVVGDNRLTQRNQNFKTLAHPSVQQPEIDESQMEIAASSLPPNNGQTKLSRKGSLLAISGRSSVSSGTTFADFHNEYAPASKKQKKKLTSSQKKKSKKKDGEISPLSSPRSSTGSQQPNSPTSPPANNFQMSQQPQQEHIPVVFGNQRKISEPEPQTPQVVASSSGATAANFERIPATVQSSTIPEEHEQPESEHYLTYIPPQTHQENSSSAEVLIDHSTATHSSEIAADLESVEVHHYHQEETVQEGSPQDPSSTQTSLAPPVLGHRAQSQHEGEHHHGESGLREQYDGTEDLADSSSVSASDSEEEES